MPIRFVCSYGHPVVVPDHRGGKKGRCPVCNQQLIVPVGVPIPLGPGGEPLHAGPKGEIRVDPAGDAMPFGFDGSLTFAELFGEPEPATPVESSRLPALDALPTAAAPIAAAAPRPEKEPASSISMRITRTVPERPAPPPFKPRPNNPPPKDFSADLADLPDEPNA